MKTLTLDCVLMHDFVTPHTGYLENVDSLSYTDLPNGDTFYYAIS